MKFNLKVEEIKVKKLDSSPGIAFDIDEPETNIENFFGKGKDVKFQRQ